jgi:hypothetical protein
VLLLLLWFIVVGGGRSSGNASEHALKAPRTWPLQEKSSCLGRLGKVLLIGRSDWLDMKAVLMSDGHVGTPTYFFATLDCIFIVEAGVGYLMTFVGK